MPRPPKYKNKEEIQGLIEEYFANCEGEILKDDNGDVVYNKFGEPVVINRKPPTISGLAYALGFKSRQALLNYQAKKEFNDTIARAKLFIEAYTEGRLFDRDGVHGAKFRGWSDKSRDETEKETLEKLDRILEGIDRASKQ